MITSPTLALVRGQPWPGGHLLTGSGKREIKVRQSCSFSLLFVTLYWQCEKICVFYCVVLIVLSERLQPGSGPRPSLGSTNYLVGLTHAGTNPWSLMGAWGGMGRQFTSITRARWWVIFTTYKHLTWHLTFYSVSKNIFPYLVSKDCGGFVNKTGLCQAQGLSPNNNDYCKVLPLHCTLVLPPLLL